MNYNLNTGISWLNDISLHKILGAIKHFEKCAVAKLGHVRNTSQVTRLWLAIPAITMVSLRVLKYVTRYVCEVTRYVIHVTRNLNYVTRFLS